MAGVDDDEEEFFRQQAARLDDKSSRGGGGYLDREEDDFFRAQGSRIEASEAQGAPQPTADGKKPGVFSKVGNPGISKFLLGKSSAGAGSKPAAGAAAGKPPPPPRTPGGSKRAPLPSGPPKRPPDDDSDDEVLSISSEDEAEDTRRAALERQETRVIRGDSVTRAPPAMRTPPQYKGEQENGDGLHGEPELWEDVREEELVKKVREMRDPRGAAPASPPSMPNMRKAGGGESATSGQTDLVDPLGLGAINVKSLALASAGGTSVSQEEASRHLDKLLYFQETFNPRFYLARIHRDTSVQGLENGRLALKKDIATRKEQLKKLVKDNFDIFISCKNIIDDIHLRLEQMEDDQDGAGTERLADSIRDCDEVARRAFSPLLERQAQVDRIRSVQGLLQRFRTLFNLPSVIRGFVRKGEYDSAVREFVKAKSLKQNFPVNSGILKKVLEEVEKVVQEFKEVLYSQMADPNAELVQIENKIRLLLELEPEADPIWHYLQLQDRRIRGLLEGAQLEADSRLEAFQQRSKEKQQAEARWKQLQFESSQGSEVDLTLLLGDEHLLEEAPSVTTEEEADALQARLVRRLTAVLRQQLPRFWKLALSIFAGRFANFSQSQDRLSEQTPTRTSLQYQQYPTPKNEDTNGRYSKHLQEEVVQMVLGIIHSYETKVLNAFKQLEIATELRPYMRESVGEVAGLYTLLKTSDSAPTQAVAAMQQLRIEVTRRFVQRLCFITRGAAVELAEEENWIPAPTVERAGSPYAISFFPLNFEETMSHVLDHVTEVLAQLATEEAPENRMQGTENILGALRAMYDSVKSTFFESFLDFCECLEKMSRSLPQTRLPGQAAEENLEGGEEEEADEVALSVEEDADNNDYKGLQVGVPVTTADQRILMLLSNAGFCRTHIVPQLAEKYYHLWQDPLEERGRGAVQGYMQRQLTPSPEAARLLNDLDKHFLDLEMALGDKYIEIKAGHLGLAVVKYLEDGTTWATAPPVKGLRDSALELMHPLVAVHAEVYAGCQPFVEKAINMLADGLMDALNQVASQHVNLQQLDANAFCQLSIELDYFETVLHNFTTDSLSEIVYHLREMLCKRTMESVEASLADPDGERGMRRSGSRLGGEDMGGFNDAAMLQTPDDLKQMAANISRELLPGELLRTKVNVFCFRGRQGSEELEAVGGASPGIDGLGMPSSSYNRSGMPVDPNALLTRTYSTSSSGSSSLLSRVTPSSSAAGSLRQTTSLASPSANASFRGTGSLGRRGKSLGLDGGAASAAYSYGGVEDETLGSMRRSGEGMRMDYGIGSQAPLTPGRVFADKGRSNRVGRSRIDDDM